MTTGWSKSYVTKFCNGNSSELAAIGSCWRSHHIARWPCYCTASPSVRPERRRMTCVRGTTPRSHHAHLTTSPLVGYPCDSEYCSKSLCPCLPMSKRPGTVVPGRRLTLDFALSDIPVPPTATGVSLSLAHECGTLCQPNWDNLTSWPVQTAIKDSFVWVMGPQCFVTLTPCKLAL